MKILGIGVDIIENKRIKNKIKSAKFKNRIYSEKELKQSSLLKNKVGYFYPPSEGSAAGPASVFNAIGYSPTPNDIP